MHTNKPPTDRRRLVDTLLASKGMGTSGEWIAAQRAAGKSWADISYALRDAVDVQVSYEALRQWSLTDRHDQTIAAEYEARNDPNAD